MFDKLTTVIPLFTDVSIEKTTFKQIKARHNIKIAKLFASFTTL